MTAVDMAPETDLDELGRIAAELSERIRYDDLNRMRAALTDLCARHPVKAAQLLMAMAAWTDPDEPVQRRFARAESVARIRTELRLRLTA